MEDYDEDNLHEYKKEAKKTSKFLKNKWGLSLRYRPMLCQQDSSNDSQDLLLLHLE